MAEKLNLDLNLQNAAQQSAESVEHLEERERVIALLHDFYSERQKNMPIHKEIIGLVDDLKNFLETAIYFHKKWFDTTEFRVVDDVIKKERCNVGIKFKTKGGKLGAEFGEEIIKNLRIVLNNVVLEEKEISDLKELINNIKKTESELDLKVDELWEIRKKIAKELILIVPEFANLKDAELIIVDGSKGLYNLGSELSAKRQVQTETEEEETKNRTEFFYLGTGGIKNDLKNLERKYNITEEELKEIKGLKWSEEEKENLKNLMEDVGEYRAEAEKLKEGLLRSANLKFKEGGANLVKDEFARAFIRQSYEDYKLPVLHKERVVQEIMNGTFSF